MVNMIETTSELNPSKGIICPDYDDITIQPPLPIYVIKKMKEIMDNYNMSDEWAQTCIHFTFINNKYKLFYRVYTGCGDCNEIETTLDEVKDTLIKFLYLKREHKSIDITDGNSFTFLLNNDINYNYKPILSRRLGIMDTLKYLTI